MVNKAAIAKGVVRHMVGGVGAGLVGYTTGAGFSPEQIQIILELMQFIGVMLGAASEETYDSAFVQGVAEWTVFVGGLVMLAVANGLSALDKLSKENQANTIIKKRKN